MQPISMKMIYYWDRKLKKRLHVLEDEKIIIKKNWFNVSCTEDAFLQDMFQMTAITLVPGINHHINKSKKK